MINYRLTRLQSGTEMSEQKQYLLPKAMVECVKKAYHELFGEPMLESLLLEANQREIDAKTRETIYKAIVTNIIGQVPEDWNDPRIQQLYQQIRADHAQPVSQFLDRIQNERGIEIPDYDANSTLKVPILTICQVLLE